jgi:hypothetical protein
MTTYKYITDTVVAVFDDDGVCRSSGLAEALVPEGVTPEPADPQLVPAPPPTLVEQILASPADLAVLKQALGL